MSDTQLTKSIAAKSMPPNSTPNTAQLSPEARALLAEINAGPLPMPQSGGAGELGGYDAAARMGNGQGILLAPHADTHATAFADLLEHIEDSDGQMHVDERAALAAATKYKQQKQMPPLPADANDMAPAHEDAPGDDIHAEFEAEFEAESGAEPDDEFDTEFNAEIGDDFSDDDFGDDDFALDEDDEPSGFFARFAKKSAGNVRRLVGYKDANSAYDAQSGSSLLPFTIIRTVVLVLVAAVPPLVNLIVIQPQISDNNRKLTQIRSFEAKSQDDRKKADELALKIARSQKAAKRRISSLLPDTQAQALINHYLEAMQQFEVDLLSYRVTTKPERKVIVGQEVQEATVLQMELSSRYDIYVDIRKIFVEQANNIIVLDEVFETQPDSLRLKINAEFMLPTFRNFDAELDTVDAQKKEG